MAAAGASERDLHGARMSTIAVIGSFTEEGRCAHAVHQLREAELADIHAFAPFPSHKIEHAFDRRKSRARWTTFSGGVAGVLTGLAITIGTTWEWNLNAGGKPLVSWPPFIVICFELMILLGGIFGFFGFLAFSGVPALEPAFGHQERFGSDRFGVVVRCEEVDRSRVEGMMREAGAEEVSSEIVEEERVIDEA
jgi:hypothetical protein